MFKPSNCLETQPSCVNNPIIKNQTKPKNKNGAEDENGAKPFWRRNQKFLKTEQIEPKNMNRWITEIWSKLIIIYSIINNTFVSVLNWNRSNERQLPPDIFRDLHLLLVDLILLHLLLLIGLVQLKLNSGLQAPRQLPRLD